MALMLDTEVVLTAVLARDNADEGVTYRDIRKYCNMLKAEIFDKTEHRCVSFEISADELSRCVRDYPRQFTECCHRYYRGSLFKKELFEYRNKKKINQIIESVVM